MAEHATLQAFQAVRGNQRLLQQGSVDQQWMHDVTSPIAEVRQMCKRGHSTAHAPADKRKIEIAQTGTRCGRHQDPRSVCKMYATAGHIGIQVGRMIQCAIETGAATLRIGSKACVRDNRWRMDGDCHGKVSRASPRRHSASCVRRGCHDGHSSELIRNSKGKGGEDCRRTVEIIIFHPNQHELAQKGLAAKADRQLRGPHCPHRTARRRRSPTRRRARAGWPCVPWSSTHAR